MEKIIENSFEKQTKDLKQNELFELSRQAGLACLNSFPKAQVVYRITKDSKVPWKDPKIHLTSEQIKQYKAQQGYFAVILESIKLCVIDFDLKSKIHPAGIELKDFYKVIEDWNLKKYPFQQKTQSGGSHFLFKNPPEGLTGESNKFGIGIDYLVGIKLLCLYDPDLWKHNLNDLIPIPDLAIQAWNLRKEKQNLNGNNPPSGHGQTNTLLNSGFGTYKTARTPFQLGHKCFEIVEEYKANPGKTSKDEAKEKLGRSLIDGLSKNKTVKIAPDKKTESPKIDLSNIEFIHNIIPKGFFILLTGETGTGKTNIASFICAKELLQDSKKKLYFYSQESDWNHNVVPYFLSAGMTKEQISKQVIFKDCVDYETEKDQVLFDIQKLNKGDFVIIEPARILTNKPNDSSEVCTVIKEYQELAKNKDLFLFALHHTTTGWAGATIKEQSKFCKEWLSFPRHAIILKEQKTDGDCIMFVQKSNLIKRVGAITFTIESKDIPVTQDFTLKNKPAIKSFECKKDLSTKDILKKYFKHEAGLEKPRRQRESTQELRGLIVKYIKNNANGSPPKDHVLRPALEAYCELNGRFTKAQIKHALTNLKQENIIRIFSGPGNRSEYRMA